MVDPNRITPSTGHVRSHGVTEDDIISPWLNGYTDREISQATGFPQHAIKLKRQKLGLAPRAITDVSHDTDVRAYIESLPDGDRLPVAIAIIELLIPPPDTVLEYRDRFGYLFTPAQQRVIHLLWQRRGKICTHEALAMASQDVRDDIADPQKIRTVIARIRPLLPDGVNIENAYQKGYYIKTNFPTWPA